MKHAGVFATAALILLTGLAATPPNVVGQDQLGDLLSKLAGEHLNRSALYAIEAQPADPRTIPTLEKAFDLRGAKNEKQMIAVLLLRLGDKGGKFFDFLAGYAQAAVEDRTPFSLAFDASGKEIKGQFAAEFQNWCALNGKEPKSVAAAQWGVYFEDVVALAEAQDARASELFRRGLDSLNPLVVAASVQGLGRLQDVAAIPLIAKACERIPGARRAIAAQLPWYSSPEAEALMERLDPDRKSGDFHRESVQRLRAIETKRVLSRQGPTTAK